MAIKWKGRWCLSHYRWGFKSTSRLVKLWVIWTHTSLLQGYMVFPYLHPCYTLPRRSVPKRSKSSMSRQHKFNKDIKEAIYIFSSIMRAMEPCFTTTALFHPLWGWISLVSDTLVLYHTTVIKLSWRFLQNDVPDLLVLQVWKFDHRCSV